MRIFKLKRLVQLMLVGVSCGSAVSTFAFADDEGKGEPPAKPAAAAKIEAPAQKNRRWTRNSLRQKFGRTLTISMISTIPKTIRSAGRAKFSGPMKSR